MPLIEVNHRCGHFKRYIPHPNTSMLESVQITLSESRRVCNECVVKPPAKTNNNHYYNNAKGYDDGMEFA